MKKATIKRILAGVLYIGFYLWYVMEWMYHLVRLHNFMKAYYALSFEREAYAMQDDLNYKYKRKRFAWARGQFK